MNAPVKGNVAEGATTFEAQDDLDAINALYRERRWGDGLPIVPPTRERVERMLGGLAERPRQDLRNVTVSDHANRDHRRSLKCLGRPPGESCKVEDECALQPDLGDVLRIHPSGRNKQGQ